MRTSSVASTLPCLVSVESSYSTMHEGHAVRAITNFGTYVGVTEDCNAQMRTEDRVPPSLFLSTKTFNS